MIAGVDGCKNGWLVALAESWPSAVAPKMAVVANFKDLIEQTQNCRAAAVDVPIGLPEGKRPRSCDVLGRKYLGQEGQSRVFKAPPVECLKAGTPEEFQDLHLEIRGMKAGFLLWGIIPKLRDAHTYMTLELQARIFEFHPELAWKRLAGQLLPTKHGAEGRAIRKSLLKKFIPAVDACVEASLQTPGVEEADVLDALIGLRVAQTALESPTRFPPEEERGSQALKMEIFY